jgi:hypothetical protein
MLRVVHREEILSGWTSEEEEEEEDDNIGTQFENEYHTIMNSRLPESSEDNNDSNDKTSNNISDLTQVQGYNTDITNFRTFL